MQQHLDYAVIDLAQLEPFDGNARRHDDQTLANSVKVHGQYRTIVVRVLGDPAEPDRQVIVAGNGTAEALRAQGHTQARVERIICTDDEALGINLIDNYASDKAHEIGYDPELLAAQLQQAQEFGYAGAGWTAAEANAIMNPPERRAPGGGEPGEDVWAIIVEARDEDHQVELLKQFELEGLTCRPLIA